MAFIVIPIHSAHIIMYFRLWNACFCFCFCFRIFFGHYSSCCGWFGCTLHIGDKRLDDGSAAMSRQKRPCPPVLHRFSSCQRKR